MSLPPELQKLADRWNELVAEFNAGHISESDAMSTLGATSTTDGDGAIWGVAPQGHFLRAEAPGEPAHPADPSTYVDPSVPRAPTPAFPAPVYPPPPSSDPNAQQQDYPQPAHDWSITAPQVGPVLPNGEPASSKTLKNIKPRGAKPAILTHITGFLSANKSFVIIAAVAVIVVLAALLVPKLTSNSDATQMPTSSALPGEEIPADAPAVTSEAPTTLDAANVATTLQAGTPEQIQALIAAELDAVTLLRTQALWAGVAQTQVTLTPQAAAANGDGTATQKWDLTRPDGTEPVTTIDVTWVTDGTAWKLAAPPTF